MRVLILGATGRTGKLVVRAARDAGHDVTVLVREPARLDSLDGLNVVAGDARDRTDMSRALAGQEGVISALGSPSPLRSDIATPAASNFVPIAQSGQAHRVIVMSAFGIGESRRQAGPLARALFATAARSLYRDKTAADEIVRRSDLDWTIVCPVVLTDDPGTGAVTAGARRTRAQSTTISRADVAYFLVSALTSSQWSRTTVVISS